MYPNEPISPELTDRYLLELKAWGNRVLGIATRDRLAWRAERRCIRRLQKTGQIR